jgi:hypothetical protein
VLTPGGQVPSLAAGLGLLALNYGCSYDPAGGVSFQYTGCQKASPGGRVKMFWYLNGSKVGQLAGDATEIVSFRWETYGSGYRWWLTQKEPDGINHDYTFSNINNPGGTVSFKSELISGTCALNYGGTPTAPAVYRYTDTTTNCIYNVEHLAWEVLPGGEVVPIVKISSGTPQQLASGGVISGCNFSPVVYRGPGGPGGGGGGGNGPFAIPWNPGPNDPNGNPWWVSALQGAIGGAVGFLVRSLLEQYFGKKAPANVYRLVSVCETNQAGEAISQSRERSIAEQPILDGLLSRVDALTVLMQGLKDFKQPICPPQKPTYSGESVTVRFVSDAVSPQGHDVLRKTFSYLDQSARPLEDHTDHWADFSWEAGPVCVIHKGGPWGVPQVWAATADEGKRVIRHAGTVAGVDPDAVGSWIVTGSADSRYGVKGTMRVMRRAGAICVSKRIGPSGLPLLATPAPTP